MRVRPAAQRVYKGFPAARIIESGTTPSAFVASTETLAAILTNFAKVGALASLPIGILLLISYLRYEGAPLPAADTSISVLLSLMCVIFLFISVIFTSIFLLPTLTKISDGSRSQAVKAFPLLNEKRSTPKRLKQSLWEYCLDFGPFVSCLFFVFFRFGLSNYDHGLRAAIAIGVGIFVAYCVVCVVYSRIRHRRLVYLVDSNVHSLLSFVVLLQLATGIVGHFDWNPNAWLIASVCVLVPWAFHLLAVTLVTTWRAAVSVYVVALVVSLFWPGFGYLGGQTLRFIGIGGGIPVTIMVRNYGETGSIPSVQGLTGCLILMTAGDVLIRPAAKASDCKLHPQLTGGQPVAPIETYSQVERYARADVTRVSKFADPCGTVDGLQSTRSSCESAATPAQ